MEMLPGMELKSTKYGYCRRGRGWSVYREETWMDKGSSPPGEFTSGTKVGEYPTKEEARREVYRLNGWKMKEEKKK